MCFLAGLNPTERSVAFWRKAGVTAPHPSDVLLRSESLMSFKTQLLNVYLFDSQHLEAGQSCE